MRALRHAVSDALLLRAATSRPPSVVSSSRRSGTKQQSAGRCLHGKLDHRIGDGHLEVYARLQGAQQDLDIARLDVPPVFAQVHRDAVGARLLGDQCAVTGSGIARGVLAAASQRDRH